ncbi:MAG TPA: mismatch-specific DNA-glycosylase [Planctomycetota bacterium]|nr:mismatch-specific DNA-glycosylase [Planctomycetota bacterium]
MRPLADFLRPGLRLLLVGLNPGTYSARVGRYFARPGNLFWPALSQSGLVSRPVEPGDESLLHEQGIGLTDVVHRPSASIDEVAAREWREGAAVLRGKIERYRPASVAFVGLRGARAVLGDKAEPGLQSETIAGARLFALPSPSRRNAAYGREAVFAAFRELATLVGRRGPDPVRVRSPGQGAVQICIPNADLHRPDPKCARIRPREKARVKRRDRKEGCAFRRAVEESAGP